MRRLLPSLAILCSAFAPAPLPKTTPAKRDPNAVALKELQGEWVLVSLNGEKLNDASVVIASDRVKYLLNGKVMTEWVVTLDATKSPRVFDQKLVRGTNGPREHPGIYALDNDTLKLCSAYSRTGVADRPLEFQGSGISKRFYVLKRKKP
jgi:uncharacterized protein (TIGR03067 family)